MKKRLKIGVVVFLIMALFLVGCQSTAKESVGSSKASSDKIQIGLCFDSFVIERWQRDRDIFVSTAKELGAEVNVQNANGDAARQKEQIDYFIKKEMDVIVIISIDGEAILDSVKKAQDEGILVIAYDRPIANADVDLYISFDNEKVGRMMGEALAENGLTGGKVVMICGSPTDNNVPMVEKGFREAMEENSNEILDVFYADGWKAEAAGNYVYSNSELIEQADAIMCGNDDLASRVVYALSEKRLAGKIMVVGQDADLEACQRIVEGTQLMTVYKPIEQLAKKAAESAIGLARKEKLSEENISEYDDGSHIVPYLKIDPVSVTSANMDEVIINSGFHLREDVYLNVQSN